MTRRKVCDAGRSGVLRRKILKKVSMTSRKIFLRNHFLFKTSLKIALLTV